MALRHTVDGTEESSKRFGRAWQKKRVEGTTAPLLGTLPRSIETWSAYEAIIRSGVGTTHIDEVWNVADLSTEVPRLIDRFGIPQNFENQANLCENQKASTYTGTSAEKDSESGERHVGGSATDVLKSILSDDESLMQSICDSFAQDYICFGFEPPRQCSELRSSMVKYDLILYQEP